MAGIINNRESILKILDRCILGLGGIYLVYMTLTMTMFGFDMPEICKIILFALMCIVSAFRLMVIGLRNQKIWLSIALAAVECCVFLFSGYAFFLFIAALTVGFVEMDYRRILNVYLMAVGIVVVVTVIAAMTGTVEMIVRESTSHKNARSAMGMIYPTDFASIVLSLAAFLWVRWKKLPKWTALGLPVIPFLVSWLIADSRTGMIGSALFFLAVFIYAVLRERVDRENGHGMIRRIAYLAVFPLCAIVVILLVKAFMGGNEFAARMDSAINYRLGFAASAWQEHGVHPFGSSFELIGFGGVTSGWPAGYNFIDISYALILIRYGYVLLLALALSWGYMAWRAEKAAAVRLLLVMVIICVCSLSEHHFIEMNYNIALIMPFAAFSSDKEQEVRG